MDYWIGRVLGFVFIALMFFALYKYLPIRRVPPKAAWVAAAFTSVVLRGGAHGVQRTTRETFNPGVPVHRDAHGARRRDRRGATTPR